MAKQIRSRYKAWEQHAREGKFDGIDTHALRLYSAFRLLDQRGYIIDKHQSATPDQLDAIIREKLR